MADMTDEEREKAKATYKRVVEKLGELQAEGHELRWLANGAIEAGLFIISQGSGPTSVKAYLETKLKDLEERGELSIN